MWEPWGFCLVQGCKAAVWGHRSLRRPFGHRAGPGRRVLMRRLVGLALFPFSLGLCPCCFLIVVLSTARSSLPRCRSHFFFLSSVSPAVPRPLPSRALPLSVSRFPARFPARLGLFSAACRLRAGRGQMEAGQALEIHPSHPGWGRVGRTGKRSSWPCPCHSQCPFLLLASTRCW